RCAEANHTGAGDTPVFLRAARQSDFRVGLVRNVVRLCSAGSTGSSGSFRDGGGGAVGSDGRFNSSLGIIEIYGLDQSEVSSGRGCVRDNGRDHAGHRITEGVEAPR